MVSGLRSEGLQGAWPSSSNEECRSVYLGKPWQLGDFKLKLHRNPVSSKSVFLLMGRLDESGGVGGLSVLWAGTLLGV